MGFFLHGALRRETVEGHMSLYGANVIFTLSLAYHMLDNMISYSIFMYFT